MRRPYRATPTGATRSKPQRATGADPLELPPLSKAGGTRGSQPLVSPTPMPRFLTCASLCLALILVVGCGKEIGDACALSSECSAQGDRICDIASPGGYCTVFGCDFDTCPEESVCVRFFSVSSSNLTCDPLEEDISEDRCTPDELCTFGGSCVPRSAEFRYCMKKCGGNGDCRNNYECRDEEAMRIRGGEPVLRPEQSYSDNLQDFCAPTPIVQE